MPQTLIIPEVETTGVTVTPDASTPPPSAPTKNRAGTPRRPVRARGKKSKTKKGNEPLWRYTAGDHGHAVTVFKKRKRTNYYIEWWSTSKNKMERHSLGHANEQQAREQARKMSDLIRLNTQPSTDGTGEPTLVRLLQLYYMEHGKKLGGYQPAEHDRRRRMWIGFFEKQPRPIVYSRDLDNTLFGTFISQRRHGDLDVEGISLPEAAPKPLAKTSKREAVVSDGTIDADLIFLNAALNWATEYRVAGEPLLKSKPKVPRCKPQTGTLRTPVAAEDDLEALRPILDDVDPQRLLRYWMELVNQFGWRVTGLSHIKACELDFTPQAHEPHGRLLKNSAIDKERRNDGVPLTARAAGLLRKLLVLRGLEVGDDAYLFPAPKGGGTKPWSRWHVGRLLVRAEAAAGIAHIGGLHAWRRKWHTERKNYPAQDVAVAAGYADTRSVDRYRHADAETTYLVVSTPTVVIRRAPRVEQPDGNTAGAGEPETSVAHGSPTASVAPTTTVATVAHANRQAVPAAARPRRPLRRSHHKEPATPVTTAAGVGQGRGSAARSVMPDGTVVDSRDKRFAANLAVAQAYAAEHGHLLPKKHERPNGVNLLMWLKNQELRIKKGTMPPERRAELETIAAWRERVAR